MQPTAKLLTFKIDIERLILRKLVMASLTGQVLCDGEAVFHAKNIRVGLFKEEA